MTRPCEKLSKITMSWKSLCTRASSRFTRKRWPQSGYSVSLIQLSVAIAVSKQNGPDHASGPPHAMTCRYGISPRRCSDSRIDFGANTSFSTGSE